MVPAGAWAAFVTAVKA
ncbi:hypothetical protein [Streptomyces sp. PmtA]